LTDQYTPFRRHHVSDRLQPGDPAPDFTLTDDSGDQVALADLAGRKAIVYFYPKAMTPGCTTQACEFTDSLEDLSGAGYEVVGISPDSPAALARFREKDGLTIRLLSNPQKDVLRAWGAFGEKMNYGKKVEGVIRSTVVLDEAGVVTHAWYNVKATGHVAKVRRELGIQSGESR